MDRDPGDFPRALPHKPVADMSDDEFDAWMATLPPCPGIRHIDDSDIAADQRALAEASAGRAYEHAVVAQWFRTWGGPDYKPFGEWLAERDG